MGNLSRSLALPGCSPLIFPFIFASLYVLCLSPWQAIPSLCQRQLATAFMKHSLLLRRQTHALCQKRLAPNIPLFTIPQIQLAAVPDSPTERNRLLDATRPWDERVSPWRRLGVLRLYAALTDPDDAARARFGTELGFNPWHAPPGLGMPLATSARQCASLAHMRSVVYQHFHCVQTGKPIPDSVQELLSKYAGPPVKKPALRSCPFSSCASPAPAPKPLKPRALDGRPPNPRAAVRATANDGSPRRMWEADTSIAVIGAGIGGLAAAMRLKALGYTNVSVFDRDSVVGGKCQGMEVGGLWFDLGGQFLARGASPTVFRLAAELGAEWQPLGHDIFRAVDLEAGGTVRPFKGNLLQTVKAQQAVEPFQKVGFVPKKRFEIFAAM